jgi:hypothetical protein
VATWDPLHPSLWPSDSQRLLLRAALLEGEPAAAAWREWQAHHDDSAHQPASLALLPFLYLKSNDLQLDQPTRARLRAAYFSTWAKNQIVIHGLLETLHHLQQASIDALVLKGVPLLLFYYRDRGARMMADVDLLVRPEDLPRAAHALETAGWRLDKPLPPENIAPIVRALSCSHPRHRNLDLHWRPFTIDCPPEPEAQFWRRAEAHTVEGVAMRVPEPTDLLLLMCVHGRKQDSLSICRWVVDATVLIEHAQPPIDWDALLERSRQAGLLPPVRDALTFLRREFGAAVPETALERARSISTSPREMQRYRELVRETRLHRGLWDVIACQWWRYSGARRAAGARPSASGFLDYYLAYKQWEWQLGHKWQVPLRATATAVRRVWSNGL